MKFFKYCPNCKAEVKVTDRLIDCRACGFHFYFNPSPTNALIFENKKGEILLTKKEGGPKKGFWDLPGGFVEFNENMEEALKREIREELNIEIKDYKYFGSYPGYYPYRGFIYRPLAFIYSSILTLKQTKKLKPADDISEIKFFSKNKIPWSKIAFIDVKTALKDYLSSF